MKKIYLIFIISFFFGLNNITYWNDDDLYNQYIQYDYNQDFETICYSNYYYNNRFYKLYMPCSRDEFIRLEFAVYNWTYLPSEYEYKLVFLNQLLIKKWLEPLYY